MGGVHVCNSACDSSIQAVQGLAVVRWPWKSGAEGKRWGDNAGFALARGVASVVPGRCDLT